MYFNFEDNKMCKNKNVRFRIESVYYKEDNLLYFINKES